MYVLGTFFATLKKNCRASGHTNPFVAIFPITFMAAIMNFKMAPF